MARSISLIESSILQAIASNPVLSALNSPSQAAIYTQIAYIIATSQGLEEQLNDQFVSEVEDIVNVLAPCTSGWIQQQAFNFQYSLTNPQIIQFSTASFTPYYPIVNPSYQIVEYCSVQQQGPGVVIIKVAGGASGSVPQQLTTPQVQALQYYFNQIKPVGLNYNVLSLPSDRLYSVFTVTAYGAYSSNMASNLLSAYNSYLGSINFGGTIKFVDILIALRQVTGVIDVKCINMTARPNSTTFGGGTVMVSSSTVEGTTTYGQSEYVCAAGFISDELSPNDFLTNLTINYI